VWIFNFFPKPKLHYLSFISPRCEKKHARETLDPCPLNLPNANFYALLVLLLSGNQGNWVRTVNHLLCFLMKVLYFFTAVLADLVGPRGAAAFPFYSRRSLLRCPRTGPSVLQTKPAGSRARCRRRLPRRSGNKDNSWEEGCQWRNCLCACDASQLSLCGYFLVDSSQPGASRRAFGARSRARNSRRLFTISDQFKRQTRRKTKRHTFQKLSTFLCKL